MTDHPETPSSRPPRSAACHAVLAQLAEIVADPGRPLPDHARECARCSASIAGARSISGLLRALPRPELPAALTSSAFLAGVYDRANAAVAASPLGDALREGIVPAVAPPAGLEAAEWQHGTLDQAQAPSAAGELVASLGSTRAPGWLWARIRADLREATDANRRRAGVLRMAAAAAFLFAVSWAVRHDWGTSPRSPHVGAPDIELVPVTEPIASNDSPAAVFRTIAYTPTSGR